MKNILILSIIFLFTQNTFAQIISNSGLGQLERKLFFQKYENEPYDIRVQRLENKLFGATQQGSLDDRYLTLRSAIKNYKIYNPYSNMQNHSYNSYNNSYQKPLFTGASGSSWKDMVWGNFRNQFIGTPTGMTPAMDPAYMDWFEADRYSAGNGEHHYTRTNRGYNYNSTDTGSKSGVTILD